MLIDAGANVNFLSYRGTTALHYFAVLDDFPRVQQLLRAGAHANKNSPCWNNAVRYYIQYYKQKRINQNMAKLLFAAGDHVGIADKNTGTRQRCRFFIERIGSACSTIPVPEFLCKIEQEELSLMSMCRAAVRHYMLRASDLNLFMRVPTLEIPCVLMDYLLYDMSVEKDYDCYEDDNTDDDDGGGGDDDDDDGDSSDNNSGDDGDDDDDDDDGDSSDNNSGYSSPGSDASSQGDANSYSDNGSQGNHSDDSSWNSGYSSDEAQDNHSHSDDDSLGSDYDPFKSDDEY